MEDNVCHEMRAGEILNASHDEYPLHEAVIYGGRIDCAKFSKRLSCAIKHLPIRVQFSFEYDPEIAIEQGATKDTTLVLDGEIFLEGLVHQFSSYTPFFLLKEYRK